MQEKLDTLSLFLDRLESLRKRQNWSYVTLARETRISRSLLYGIKKGSLPLSRKMHTRLCEAEERAGVMPAASEPKALLDWLLDRGDLATLIGRLGELHKDGTLSPVQKWELATYIIPKLQMRLDAEK